MAVARSKFYGWCADRCRTLARRSLVVPKAFDRLADWFVERAR